MPWPNPFQTAAHRWLFALRRAAADGDTFHVVATGNPLVPRAVLSDRDLFARDDLTPEDIERAADPFHPAFGLNRGE